MTGRKRILVITAHPDDADVHAGGTIARWADEGHEVHSAILTRGDKGHDDPHMTPERVAALREAEQRAAAEILGVAQLTFFGYGDGNLTWAGPPLTEDLTRLIRVERPDIVVTHDPFALDALVNRAPGPLFYPAHGAQGIRPHRVGEILLIMGDHLDHVVDITSTFERKVRAVLAHASQFGHQRDFPGFLRRWAERVGEPSRVALAEGFKRLVP